MSSAAGKRSQGHCRDGILVYSILCYSGLMRTILYFAPGGFPGLRQSREVWQWLDRKYDIMCADQRQKKRDVSAWSSECADSVRLMLKTLVDIKTSESRVDPDLNLLLDRVVCGTSSSSSLGRSLSPVPSCTSRVQFCGANGRSIA